MGMNGVKKLCTFGLYVHGLRKDLKKLVEHCEFEDSKEAEIREVISAANDVFDSHVQECCQCAEYVKLKKFQYYLMSPEGKKELEELSRLRLSDGEKTGYFKTAI